MLCLCSLTACTATGGNLTGGDFASDYAVIGDGEQTVTSSGPLLALNPLTGVRDLDPAAQNLRPVAVSINNEIPGQAVYTGLNAADVVYETYIEGGDTRLLAVFKDIAKAPQIGTIRSARYDFVDLAAGHDAVYLHAGVDTTYCQPYLDRIGADDINFFKGAFYSYAFRVKNGKAVEHTLYTTGSNVAQMLQKQKWRTTLKSHTGLWANFRAEADAYTPAEGVCNRVIIPFSGHFKPGFTYDATTKLYSKHHNGNPNKDYVTGEAITVKNIFICLTAAGLRPDGQHMDIDLSKGKGYYISEGGYQEITWAKGNRQNAFVFKDLQGNVLKPNAGTSWVNIVRKSAKIQFE